MGILQNYSYGILQIWEAKKKKEAEIFLLAGIIPENVRIMGLTCNKRIVLQVNPIIWGDLSFGTQFTWHIER